MNYFIKFFTFACITLFGQHISAAQKGKLDPKLLAAIAQGLNFSGNEVSKPAPQEPAKPEVEQKQDIQEMKEESKPLTHDTITRASMVQKRRRPAKKAFKAHPDIKDTEVKEDVTPTLPAPIQDQALTRTTPEVSLEIADSNDESDRGDDNKQDQEVISTKKETKEKKQVRPTTKRISFSKILLTAVMVYLSLQGLNSDPSCDPQLSCCSIQTPAQLELGCSFYNSSNILFTDCPILDEASKLDLKTPHITPQIIWCDKAKKCCPSCNPEKQTCLMINIDDSAEPAQLTRIIQPEATIAIVSTSFLSRVSNFLTRFF